MAHRQDWLDGSAMAIIAHRGGAALGPENSLEVLDVAAQFGAAAVEIDVQELGDGSIVLAHDAFVASGDEWFWIRDLDLAGYARHAASAPVLLDQLLQRLEPSTLGLYLMLDLIAGAWIERLHRQAIGVIGWNSNDTITLTTMATLGLIAACTDDPRCAPQ